MWSTHRNWFFVIVLFLFLKCALINNLKILWRSTCYGLSMSFLSMRVFYKIICQGGFHTNFHLIGYRAVMFSPTPVSCAFYIGNNIFKVCPISKSNMSVAYIKSHFSFLPSQSNNEWYHWRTMFLSQFSCPRNFLIRLFLVWNMSKTYIDFVQTPWIIWSFEYPYRECIVHMVKFKLSAMCASFRAMNYFCQIFLQPFMEQKGLKICHYWQSDLFGKTHTFKKFEWSLIRFNFCF